MKQHITFKPRTLTFAEIKTRRRALKLLIALVDYQKTLAKLVHIDRNRLKRIMDGFDSLHLEEAADLVALSQEQITLARLVPNLIDRIAYIQRLNTLFPTSTKLNFLECSDVEQAIDPHGIATHLKRIADHTEFESVIINQDFEVIANAALYRAYQQLQWDEIPVCYVHVDQLLQGEPAMLKHVAQWLDREKYALEKPLMKEIKAINRGERTQMWGDRPTFEGRTEEIIAPFLGYACRDAYRKVRYVMHHGILTLQLLMEQQHVKRSWAQTTAKLTPQEQQTECAKRLAALGIKEATLMQVGDNTQTKT